jgi:hypothetical protein
LNSSGGPKRFDTSTPISRTSACSGIFQYALISSDDRASSTDRAVR